MLEFPYTDGLMEAKESNLPGWIQIDWLYPGKQPLKAGRTFFKLDRAVKEHGFKGWLMWSDRSHSNMHRHIMRVGGVPYAADTTRIFFKKAVRN